VLEVAEREGAHSYDAPNAEYTHRDGLCSFEVLLEEYKLDDPALQLLARIVHGADVADDHDATPQSRGLLAVAEGFHLLELGDHRVPWVSWTAPLAVTWICGGWRPAVSALSSPHGRDRSRRDQVLLLWSCQSFGAQVLRGVWSAAPYPMLVLRRVERAGRELLR